MFQTDSNVLFTDKYSVFNWSVWVKLIPIDTFQFVITILQFFRFRNYNKWKYSTYLSNVNNETLGLALSFPSVLIDSTFEPSSIFSNFSFFH